MRSQTREIQAQSDGLGRGGGFVRRWVLPRPTPKSVNPALRRHAQERAKDGQNRLADTITAFAGSMTFVYIHMVWFGCWIVFAVEGYPFGLLTMIVSLESIFLSTFILISQNRADARRQVIADQQWSTVQEEDEQNKTLLDLSEQILTLTKEVRDLAAADRMSTSTLHTTDQPAVEKHPGGSIQRIVRGLATLDPVDAGDGVDGEVGRLLAAGDARAARGAPQTSAPVRSGTIAAGRPCWRLSNASRGALVGGTTSRTRAQGWRAWPAMRAARTSSSPTGSPG